MPSFIGTRLALSLSGGEAEFDPSFFRGDPMALVLGFPSNISLGPGAPNFTGLVTAPKLDRLQRMIRYINNDGTATPKFVLDWQNTMEAIEGALLGLTGGQENLQILYQQVKAALDLALAANATATETAAATSITNSYTDPVSVLTATSGGVITISAHDRVYGDGARVAVDGGSVSGFSPGDYVSVYYDDPARSGGSVTYFGTTDTVAQAGNRHSVGQITIPNPGSSPSTGGGVSPPGYQRALKFDDGSPGPI